MQTRDPRTPLAPILHVSTAETVGPWAVIVVHVTGRWANSWFFRKYFILFEFWPKLSKRIGTPMLPFGTINIDLVCCREPVIYDVWNFPVKDVVCSCGKTQVVKWTKG